MSLLERWKRRATGAAAPFLKAVREADSLFPAGRWSPFLTNHDQPRVMTVLGGNRARARVAASAMLMLPGLPFVYYGEEIGMSGTKPDEQIRTPMQWSGAPGGGFTTGTPWESAQPDWAVTNVQAQERDPGSLLNHYRRLIHLRNAHPALGSGDLAVAAASDNAVAGFVRRSPGETLLIAVNFGDRATSEGSVTMAPGRAFAMGRFERIYEDPSNWLLARVVNRDEQLSQVGANCPLRLLPVPAYGRLDAALLAFYRRDSGPILLAGSNPVDFFDGHDEDLSVTDLSGSSR